MPTAATVSKMPMKPIRSGMPASVIWPPSCEHTSLSQNAQARASAAPREKPKIDTLISSTLRCWLFTMPASCASTTRKAAHRRAPSPMSGPVESMLIAVTSARRAAGDSKLVPIK